MTEDTNPFVPDARVAVFERYGDGVTEAFVDKAYKSGNFTLRGSKQQWRPWSYGYDNRWRASETGHGWNRRSLEIWDETTDKELAAKFEAAKAKARWQDLCRKVGSVKNPTAAMCDAVEAALALPSEERS